MFGLGGMEVLVILLVGVVVLGPERLPKVMRSVTKVMSEFRRISTDLQRTINSELHLEEYNRTQALENKKTVKKKKKKKPAPAPADDAEAAPESSPEPAPEAAPVEDPAKAQPDAPENGPESETDKI